MAALRPEDDGHSVGPSKSRRCVREVAERSKREACMCRPAAAGPVPRWCEGRNVWLSTSSVEPDVLWFRCVNQLASVYWPPKMFVTTVSIMVLVGPGPPTPANKPWDLDWAGILLQAGCQRE